MRARIPLRQPAGEKAGGTVEALHRAYRACRSVLIVIGCFSLAINLLMLTIPVYMMQVYDRVLASQSIETLLMLSILALCALAMVGFLEFVRSLLLVRMSARLESILGEPTLEALVDRGESGDTNMQGLRDLAQLRQIVSSPLICALFDAPVAPVFLALLFFVHPHIGWIALVAAIAIIAVSIVNQWVTRSATGESSRFSIEAMQAASALVRNAEAVRAMGMFPFASQAWRKASDLALGANEMSSFRNAALTGLTRFLRLTLQVAILGYGAWLVINENLSAGIIIASSIISARALAPLDQLVGGWRNLLSGWFAARRLQMLLLQGAAGPDRTSLPPPDGRVAMESVGYVPAPGKSFILRGADFKVESGEIVAVVGPSGAGKSTLAKLLVGAIQPSTGVIRIGGNDIRHWPAYELGPHIGYLPQDVELFPGSVAANIARLAAEPDAEKVHEAARFAMAHEMIQKLPEGYDTQLGPVGLSLSGGQRQRIGLARAFFGEPRVVVLDEPNSHLDTEGDQALLQVLRRARESGITCIVVTQRRSMLEAVTQLMVLRDGRIEAYGPRDAVLAKMQKDAGQRQRRKGTKQSNVAPITARFG